jgi:hypothetical protein
MILMHDCACACLVVVFHLHGESEAVDGSAYGTGDTLGFGLLNAKEFMFFKNGMRIFPKSPSKSKYVLWPIYLFALSFHS